MSAFKSLPKSAVWLTTALFLLSGCGGSGSSSDNNSIAPLSVNAGNDIQLDEKLTFSLKAVASPAGGSFTWRQKSGPIISGFPLTGAEQQVVAPDIKQDESIELEVEYVALDNRTVRDSVTVFVKSVNLLPVVSIKQTSPNELPSKYGDLITLSSSDSFDPDGNGSLQQHIWQQESGVVIAIEDMQSPDLVFNHPLLAQNEEVRFRLSITDDEGGTQSNSIALTLQQSNQLIFADAGSNQQAFEFTTVELNATASHSIAGEVSCLWQQVSGTAVSLSNNDVCKTQFIVPNLDAEEVLIFEVQVLDASNQSDSAQTQVTVKPKPLGLINDTGMTLCYNNSGQLPDCASDIFPNQDAAKGRDIHAGLIDKVGAGPEAFDFTKLDLFAGELADDATDFSCVRDNVTGLIWEVKQQSNGTLPNTLLREGQNMYSWSYSGDGNGGNTGVEAPPIVSCPSSTNCGLEQFVAEVNASNYCGGNNWRIPSYSELSSLLHFGQQGSGSVMISDYFPHTATTEINDMIPYWTVQTSAEGGQSAFAWAIDVATGKDVGYPKANLGYIRLVRDTSNND